MKKYVTPVLEVIQVQHLQPLLDESVSPWGEGKTNDLIDEGFDLNVEDDEENSWYSSRLNDNLWDD